MPWPTPMHIVHSAYRPPVRRSWCAAVAARRAPEAPSGMAQGDGAAVGIEALGVVRQAEGAQHGQGLGREGLVEFDDIEITQGKPGPGQDLADSGHGANAHDARLHAGDRHGHDPCQGNQAVALDAGLRSQEQGAGAVVDARSVAGGDRAARPSDGRELREGLKAGLGPWMLVDRDGQRVAFALGECGRARSPRPGGRRPGRRRFAAGCAGAKASWSARAMPCSLARFSAVSGMESMP